MNLSFFQSPRSHTPRLGLDDDFTSRTLMVLTFFSIAMTVVLFSAYAFDTRTLDGSNVWIKPMKFGVSLALHFLTVALLAQQLPRNLRAGPVFSVATFLAVPAFMFEAVYVAVQAARARRSHFNNDTMIEAIMYPLMGLAVIFLMLIALVLAIQVWRAGRTPMPGLRWATIIGVSVSFFVTFALAGYMSNIESWRWIGEPVTGEVVPFFGWSREVGDLRPAHFVALHMMQTIPLAGFFMDKIKVPARTSVTIIVVLTALQAALAIALFMQALAGKPFWPA